MTRGELVEDLAATIAQKAYLWVRISAADANAAFEAIRRLLPELQLHLPFETENDLDPKWIASRVVEDAQSRDPTNFAEVSLSAQLEERQQSQVVANVKVLRTVLIRSIEHLQRVALREMIERAQERPDVEGGLLPSMSIALEYSPAPPALESSRSWRVPGGLAKDPVVSGVDTLSQPGLSIGELTAIRSTAPVRPTGLLPNSNTGATGRAPASSKWWTLAIIGLGAVVAAWLFRKELVAATAALLDLWRSSPTPLPSPSTSDTNKSGSDIVDVSAFLPPGAAQGTDTLVQVFLHAADRAEIVKALASESDPETRRAGVATIATEITRGQRIAIALDAGVLTVDEPVQHLTWRGAPTACQFFVRVPSTVELGSYPIKVMVITDAIPIAALRFKLRIVTRREPLGELTIQGDDAHRYRHAFLSYSSEDRAEVLKRAQSLKAASIDFFQDLLSIEPGERWEHRLYQEIDRSDLFLLFWSSNAARSEWVTREAEYALKRQSISPDHMPDISPIILEGPPIPSPPDSLKAIHFADPLVYLISAINRESAKRDA
jgi:hypothetical protein